MFVLKPAGGPKYNITCHMVVLKSVGGPKCKIIGQLLYDMRDDRHLAIHVGGALLGKVKSD